MIDRWVCAPQYLSAGTSSGPKLSVSVRVAVIGRAPELWVASHRTERRRNQLAYRRIPLRRSPETAGADPGGRQIEPDYDCRNPVRAMRGHGLCAGVHLMHAGKAGAQMRCKGWVHVEQGHLIGGSPASITACVIPPVPGPNPATGTVCGPRPATMARASAAEDRTTDETARGARISSGRKRPSDAIARPGPDRYLRNLSRLTISAACCGGSPPVSSISSSPSSSSSSECVSKRRPNSTEGSTKVRTASKGITRGSG
jgi:hypothetical protein